MINLIIRNVKKKLKTQKLKIKTATKRLKIEIDQYFKFLVLVLSFSI